MTDQERNKANVLAFYELMFNEDQPREAATRYIGDQYIQHNPDVGDGADAFVEAFERIARDVPGKKVTFHRVLADGDFVILHWHQRWPGQGEFAGIDIFRLTGNGKIVEHWDVIQPMPERSANPNGMF